MCSLTTSEMQTNKSTRQQNRVPPPHPNEHGRAKNRAYLWQNLRGSSRLPVSGQDKPVFAPSQAPSAKWGQKKQLPRAFARGIATPPGELPGISDFWSYLISTPAPASSSLAFALAASSLLTFSRTAFGALSTRSFASFKPRLVSSRTALMT